MNIDVKRKKELNSTRNSGFTLVEMIVAITIVGIIATLTTLSILNWQDWSRFKKQNEYAQALYVSAQNQLTAYRASGYLETFAESLIDPAVLNDESVTDYSEHYLVNTIDVAGITDDAGNTLTEGEVWKELDASGKGKYGNKVVVLKVDMGSYDDSLKLEDVKGNGELLEKYWVYALLDPYIADKEVLKKGTVSIELSPIDGQVFSVLYSDRLNAFKYSGSSSDEYNVKNREETYREKFMVGYYAVNTLTKSIAGSELGSALTLSNVVLNNKELLYLSFTQDKNTVEVNNTTYDIYLYDTEKNGTIPPELWIKLSFPEIIADKGGAYLAGAVSSQTAKSVKLPVYRYYDAAGYSAPAGAAEEYEELGELPFLIWKTGTSTVNIALDAVDYQAGSWLYEKDYAAIHDTNYKSSVSEFDDTYSYFRFGLNNDNIKCGIIASANTYSNSPIKYSNSENPVYYSEKQKLLGIIDTGYIKRTHSAGGYAYNYSIKNARHLYNIRYTEDIDRLLTPSYTINNESVTYELIRNIDWREFTAYGNVYASDIVSNANDIAGMRIEKEGEVADYYFPSICTFRANDTLMSKEGKAYVVSGLSIKEAANKAGRVSLNRTKDPATGNYEYQTKPATAFIMQNEGSLKNITFDKLKVEGNNYVAGFVGVNTAASDREISNLILENTDNETEIKGSVNVGGIIGFAAPSDPTNTAVIAGLKNKGKVLGHTAVGGIIGMVRNDYKYIDKPDAVKSEAWSNLKSKQDNLYIKIENCENYGVVEGTTELDAATDEEIAVQAQQDRYIGGIAGYCYNTTEITDNTDTNRIIISNCVSTPLYEEDELPENKAALDKKLKGIYVGGVVGYNRYGAIDRCSSYSTEGRGYVFGYKYVGGIVGLNIGPAKGTEINGAYDNKNSLNANNVFGSQYVGGITGCNATIGEKLSDGSAAADVQLDPARIEEKTAINGCVPIMLPDEKKSIKVAIKNWTNTGVVLATDSYAGGITGFNAGWVYKCKSDINSAEASACVKNVFGNQYLGDYIGGIAGFNNGTIGCTDRDDEGKRKSSAETAKEGVNVYVTGRNFVGGIVGYNAEDSIVEDYRVDGGYVHGGKDGSFIGGYAGFNESIDLLMDQETNKAHQIYSNPNEISGRFFVGGNIGGNIINTEKATDPVPVGPGPKDPEPEDPEDDEPEDDDPIYDDPFDAADDIDENVYAKIDFGGGYNNSTGICYCHVYIHNDTEKAVSCWAIPLDDDLTIPKIKFSNYMYDSEKNLIRWVRADHGYLPANKTMNDYFELIGDEATVQAFIDRYNGKKIPVKFFDSRDNTGRENWGNSIDPTKVSATLKNLDAQTWGGSCTIIVNNKSGEVLPNWRVEVEMPKETVITGCNAGNRPPDHGTIGNTIYIRGIEFGVMLPTGETEVNIYYRFNPNLSNEDLKNIGEIKPRVYFNNVTFGDDVTPGNDDRNNKGDKDDAGDNNKDDKGDDDDDAGKGDSEKPSGSDSEGKIINTVFRTDNFLGKLKGNAFVGGFVGYNMFYSAKDDAQWVLDDPDGDKGATFVLTKQMHEKVNELASSAADPSALNEGIYQKELDFLENIADDDKGLGIDIDKSSCVFLISGPDDEENWSSVTDLGIVDADIYAGGVFGYNDNDSYLYISSIMNAADVSASMAIERDEEQEYKLTEDEEDKRTWIRKKDYNGDDFDYKYSYVGGIIGKNSKNTIIDNCWNASNVIVDTKGTYTGGLCEINEGTIVHCSVSNFGNSVTDYIGGICGLNKGAGINKDIVSRVKLKDYCNKHENEVFEKNLERGVHNCSIRRATISGRNVVGGIAAENFGRIRNIEIDSVRMLVDGDNAKNKDGVCGVYAGFNGKCGAIVLENDIKNITIKSSGSNVGSVVGVNAGKLVNQRYYTAKDEKKTEPDSGALRSEKNSFYNLVIDESCKIEGYKNVGGVIGKNIDEEERIVEHYTNESAVVATHGNAGGIIGDNASENSLRYCLNNAVVAATEDGNAGGITSTNKGLISECYDYETVNAPKGMSGGIVAVNYEAAVIEDCVVEVDPASANNEIELISSKAVGGIAAQNDGEINDNELNNVTVTNYKTVIGTRIGVIAGENLIHGVINLRGNLAVKDCTAIAETNQCKVGGIAGTNDGMILGVRNESTLLPKSIINPSLMLGAAQYASLGGVAGQNTGIIEDVSVNTTIQGNLGSTKTGYGGIAGYSGYENETELKRGMKEHGGTTSYPAMIRNCTFDGVINAHGSSGAPVRVGGIAGINAKGSKISDCYIGVLKSSDDAKSGETLITAGDYINKTDVDVTKTDTVSYSNTGGIAGENYGWVSACDNKLRSKDTVKIISFAGEAGGIVGHNYRDAKVAGYIDDSNKEYYLTTGDTWQVDQRCEENDRGPGGIIGRDESAEELCYIKNYASVKSMYPTNNKVGGVIGIIEQSYIGQTPFYRVYNYGNVTSSNMAGGLVGQIRSSGAVFRECENYGDVTFGYRFGGGLIGYHNTYTQPIDFYSCANHGNITGTTTTTSNSGAGGFMAQEDGGSGNPTSYYYDCVNTGVITINHSSYPAKKKLGSFVGCAGNKYVFELCRNYNIEPVKSNGFVASGTAPTIKNCLDVSGVKTENGANSPFGGVLGTAENAYYVSGYDNNIDDTDYGVYFTWHEGATGSDMKWNNTNYDAVKDPAKYLLEPDEDSEIKANNAKPSMTFSLSYADSSKGIDSFVVYGWNDGDSTAREYNYTANIIYGSSGQPDISRQVSGSFKGNIGLDDSRGVIKLPDVENYKAKRIELSFNSAKNVSLRGFSYIPKQDTSVEARCRFAAEKNDMAFCLGTAKKTNNGANATLSVQKPAGNTYKTVGDILDIDWDDFSYFSYAHDAGSSVAIPISVTNGENSKGIDSFVFYVGNNNLSSSAALSDFRTYHYSYSVTMTDINGASASTNLRKVDSYNSGENLQTMNRVEVSLNDLSKTLDSRIESIVLTIKSDGYDTKAKPNQSDNNVYMRGFAVVPKGGQQEKMAYGGDPSAKSVADIFANGKHLIKLLADKSKNPAAPYMYVSYDHNSGFNMTANDPTSATYYADRLSYAESKAAGTNSRINVYEDIDDKFVKFVPTQAGAKEEKLAAPAGLSLDKGKGIYEFKWSPVSGASGYEVYYVLRDPEGEVKVTANTAMLGSTQTYHRISIEDSWVKGDYSIECFVRAIHSYHKLNKDKNDYQQYDSDWSQITEALVKKPLPQPQAHLEIIAGNRSVVVLENYEEYEEMGCTDITISYTLGSEDYSWNVAQYGAHSLPFKASTGTSDYKARCYAEPNESLQNRYVTSMDYTNFGQVLTNDTLPARAQYCTNTYFNGFFGNDIDKMSYSVSMALNANTGDCYQTTDISAYDEAIGATIVYDHELTHTANSLGKGPITFTSTLKNLPQEWFSEKPASKITVRAYPYKSQSGFAFYGHDVCKIATPLNANAKTEAEVKANQAVLAGIYDDNYISESSDMPEHNCVWDEGKKDLKPGYMLQRNEAGEYKLIYSSLIEMAMSAAAADSTAHREYTNYSVASIIYSNVKAESDIDAFNNLDFAESYWTRGIDGNHKFDASKFDNVALNKQDFSTIQEMMSVPVIDAFAGDESGSHIKYHLAWDKFYKDTKCFTNGDNRYKSNALITNPAQGLFETYDKYLERLDQCGLASESITNDVRLRLMNAYYYDYNEASYRVELLGKTLEGEEVVLASKTISDKTELDKIEGQKTMSGADTAYEVWDYECDFEDTNDNWVNYPEIIARIIRLGSDKSGKNNTTVVTDTKTHSTMRLPRYAEVSGDRKLKLNTISKPSVTLSRDEQTGDFVTTTLSYDVVWSGLTDENQIEDLGGYLLHLKVVNSAENVTPTKDHYYYVPDIRSKSQPGDVMVLDTEALLANSAAGDYVLTELEKDINVFLDYLPNEHRAILDLSDFTTDETVEVTVQAIARKRANVYKDGDEGVETQIVIPNRLKVPKVELLSLVTTDDEGGMPDYEDAELDRGDGYEKLPNAVSYEEYEKGFCFRYDKTDESYISEPTARIQMAIAVFDEISEDGEVWDEGAVSTLYTKEEPMDFGNVSSELINNIRFSGFEEYQGQWAGKYLKVALKAASTSRIDSLWTDGDAEDAETTDYKWIHIPKLLLDEVDIHDSTETLDNSKIDPFVTYYHNGQLYDSKQADGDETFEQVTLGFKVDRNAEGYRLTAVGRGTTDGMGNVNRPSYEIYTEKAEDGGYDAFIAAVRDASVSVTDDSDAPVCKQNSDAVWLGTLNEENKMLDLVDIAANFTLSDLKFTGRIIYESSENDGMIKLVLPDLQKTDAGVNLKDYICADAVMIATYCRDSEHSAYVADMVNLWQREVIAGVYTGKNLLSHMNQKDAQDWLDTNVGPIIRVEAPEDGTTGAEDIGIEIEESVEEEDVSQDGTEEDITEEEAVDGNSDDGDDVKPAEDECVDDETDESDEDNQNQNMPESDNQAPGTPVNNNTDSNSSENSSSGNDNSSQSNDAAADNSGMKDESKEKTREDVKDDSNNDSKENSNEESKDESKKDSNEESKDESKKDSNEESKDESKKDSNEESKDESKDASKEDSKNDEKSENNESKENS